MGLLKQKKAYMLLMTMIIVAIIAMTGCGAAQYGAKSDSVAMENSAASPREMAPSFTGDVTMVATSYDGKSNDQMLREESGEANSERKLIQNINMTLVVADVPKAFQHITELTGAMNGFVQDSRNWKANQAQHGYLTVRIPAERLAQTIIEIETLGEIDDSHTNTQDVTEQYFDREARLRNLEKQEERYLEILSEAKTTEDVLNVERELVRVREQIEVLTGQLTYMDHQINFATIYIQLQEEKTIAEYAKPSFAKAFEAAGKAVQNSINMILTAMTMAIIAAGYMLPLLPVILIVIYIFYRKVYSRRKKSAIKGTEGNDKE